MEATKCTIRMNTILSLLNYEMTDVERAIKYIEEKDQSLEKWFSDTNARLRAQKSTAEKTKMGPDDYRRDNVVIETAKNRLMSDGILSLTGWGGVGKTALAHKIIYDFALRVNTLLHYHQRLAPANRK